MPDTMSPAAVACVRQPLDGAPELYSFGPWVVPGDRGFIIESSIQMAGGPDAIEHLGPECKREVDRVRGMSDEEYDAQAPEDKPAWLSFMFVAKLKGGGLFVYSPVAPDEEGELVRELGALGDVKVVHAPGFHTSGVPPFQKAFPDAIYTCDQTFLDFGLDKNYPDNRYSHFLGGPPEASPPEVVKLLEDDFEWDYLGTQIMFFHKSSKTVITGDQLYKADGAVCDGPGMENLSMMQPAWYAAFIQKLFFDACPESSHLLPKYRVMFTQEADRPGLVAMLDKLRAWRVKGVLACHVGALADGLPHIEKSWAWAAGSSTS